MSSKSAYAQLLDEVCVGLGFCGSVVDGEPLHVDKFIPDQGMVYADDFVDWVLKAEGWHSAEVAASKYRTSLRKAFVRHMGAETVDAKKLK